VLDETSDTHMVSQLATVLRYIHFRIDSLVSLMFSGYSSDGLIGHVQNVVSKISFESKLVARTYCGESVMSGHLNGLQHKVLEASSESLHELCYAHALNIVLSQILKLINPLKSICNYMYHLLQQSVTLRLVIHRLTNCSQEE
jgi:hypothetical protein